MTNYLVKKQKYGRILDHPHPIPAHMLDFCQYTIYEKYISAHFALITPIWNVSYGKSLSSAIPDIDDSHIFSFSGSHLCKSSFPIQSNQVS